MEAVWKLKVSNGSATKASTKSRVPSAYNAATLIKKTNGMMTWESIFKPFEKEIQ